MPALLRTPMTPARRRRPAAPRQQRGITLIGLLTWAILVGFAGYLAVRVLPTVSEFYTVQAVVDRLAASPANTVPEIRQAFSKQLNRPIRRKLPKFIHTMKARPTMCSSATKPQ